MFLPEKINVDRNNKKRIIQREDNIFVGYMNELQTYSDTIFHKFEIFQILWEKELKILLFIARTAYIYDIFAYFLEPFILIAHLVEEVRTKKKIYEKRIQFVQV